MSINVCEECESLKKCKDGYILSNDDCVSCFSIKEGCEECFQNTICYKCYDNNIFKYSLNNGMCEKKNEESKENKNSKTSLKFERIDNYEKKGDTLYFKTHFILLDNYLSGAKLRMTAQINFSNRNILLRYIRSLDYETKIIDCSQYGDALGSTNKKKGGYLANFLCSVNIRNNEFLSIIIHNIEIKDYSNYSVQNFTFTNKEININDIQNSPLEEEYEQYNINKLTITKVSGVKLNNDLIFSIISNFDSISSNEKLYDIKLNSDNENQVTATCTIPIFNIITDKNISCISSKENLSQNLTFVEGIYAC